MRDYDPTTGRYIQADPLGLVDGASVYGYALQNPVRWTDVQGLYVVRCQATSTGGVGYEDGDFYEGTRKVCEYQCKRLDTGKEMTLQACGQDLQYGDVCYGVPYDQTYRGPDLVNISNYPRPFDYDTDGFWNWYNYSSDFRTTIEGAFGAP